MAGSGESNRDSSMVRSSAHSKSVLVGSGGTHFGTSGLSMFDAGGINGVVISEMILLDTEVKGAGQFDG